MKVKRLDSGYEWFWTRQKFINRKYVMQEMYEDFEAKEHWDVPAERDPFIDSPETECLIGTAEVYLKCVAYMVCLSRFFLAVVSESSEFITFCESQTYAPLDGKETAKITEKKQIISIQPFVKLSPKSMSPCLHSTAA